ncbi:MAG TPA: cytochrome c3 family protein [Candidatus Sulfotelmatobacter sp.]|nr:cytochrome c3 family protein [Candidatus Sulfotelmatobacter sp.]
MKRQLMAWGLAALFSAGTALAQISTDVLGVHNMAPASGSPITGGLGSPCLYCHAPHSGINGTVGVQGTPLWSQKLSSVTSYQVYSSTTMVNKTNGAPPLGSNSSLCLSCHDGTVALGTLTPYGQVPMSNTLTGTAADLTTNLQSTHPFSFVTPLQTAPDLWPSLSASPPSTQDTTGAVQLINGNVECGSCHNPHVQNIDSSSDFLVIDNSQSALCLSCHNTTPTGSGMGMAVSAAVSTKSATATQINPLSQWRASIHATASNRVVSVPVLAGDAAVRRVSKAATLGPYTSLRRNGCLSCHQSHNSSKALLRATDDQDCLVCHNGGTNVSPPAPDILAEMSLPKITHTGTTTSANANTAHSAREAEILNHNRHANCVDCHNPHATRSVGENFAPAPGIRPSQSGVIGISATDGRSVVYPANNQYENCLRCHGASQGKQNPVAFGYLPIRLVSAPDPLNILPEFALTSTSSHPVMHDRSSPYPQPSLRTNMLDLDGVRQGRTMGVRVLCTDCHNSDDNREFGGTGPNGPHGSKYSHILERRYDMNQASAPGMPITNLNMPPNLTPTGNYAMCAKCHDLASVVANTSFKEHARHINEGFSCSVCHSAHGIGSQSATVSGDRLVNFDVNVVAPNGRVPVSYRRSTQSCALTCHGHAHGAVGGGPVALRP